MPSANENGDALVWNTSEWMKPIVWCLRWKQLPGKAESLVRESPPHIPDHSRWWVSQALSRLFLLSASRNSSQLPASHTSFAEEVTCTVFSWWRFCTYLRGQGRMLDDLHRVDCSLIITLGELAKSWFQINCGRRTKHTAVCSTASLGERCTGHPGCLTPFESFMNWIASHRSSVGYVTLILLTCRLHHMAKG